MDVMNNVIGRVFDESESIVKSLYRHVFEPVLWHQSIQKLKERGHSKFVEFSLKPQLSNFIRFANRTAEVGLAVSQPR